MALKILFIVFEFFMFSSLKGELMTNEQLIHKYNVIEKIDVDEALVIENIGGE